MKLAEVMTEILKRVGTQEALGERLGLHQSKISGMLKAGSTSEKHWRTFVRVAQLCDSLGIDYAKACEISTAKAAPANGKNYRQKTRSASQAGKNGLEAEIISAISTRRTLLHPGKGKPGR